MKGELSRKDSTAWSTTRETGTRMDIMGDATDPMKVHPEEHADYFITLQRADNILIVIFPFFAFLS